MVDPVGDTGMKKRRVSQSERLRRANISKALKRYWRDVKAEKAARSKAARKGWITRRTGKTLRRLEKKRRVVPVAVELGSREQEEWEVTVSYASADGNLVDITFRLMGKPGVHYANDQVRAALWFTHKHGAGAMKDFSLDGLDWRNTYPRGRQIDYSYPDGKTGVQEVLDNAGGILNTVGLAGLRVALVEQ